MVWFRIDDKFHANAKVIAAGNAAIGLWTRCGAWSSDQAKEGRIPKHVAEMYGTKKEIGALLAVRLWVEDGNDYVMPDFLDFNPSNAEVEAVRAKRAQAGALGGRNSGKARRSKAEASASPLLNECFDNDEANTNPDPSQSPKTPLTPQGARKRAVVEAYISIGKRMESQAGRSIRSEAGFERMARERANAHPDVTRWLEMFPTAPANAVAAWMYGDKGSMRYYERADELDNVHELRPA
jgi:hypothetical protein